MREFEESRVTFRQVLRFLEHQNVKVPSCSLSVGPCLASTLVILHRAVFWAAFSHP